MICWGFRMLTKVLKISLLLAMHIQAFQPTISTAADYELFPPAEYIYAKLLQNDIVFLGTRHKQPDVLAFIAELIPNLKELGVTHIAVEIPSDQQDNLDTFMKTGKGLDTVEFHVQIDHPDYRNLYHVLRICDGPPPVAIDLPFWKYGGEISRDEWMAQSILSVFETRPAAKMLVIVGNLHTLKKLEWEAHVPNKRKSIREYIEKKRPEIKLYSVGEMIHGNPDECDFTKEFSQLPGAVALDLDGRYRGWKLGMTSTLAIVPAECFELVDGLIVY